MAATFSNGVVIPEYVYIAFQMTFACITPALIVGAFAERMKFSALLLFMALWVTFVYFPIAHMVWYWAGPDALADAAKAVAAATGDAKKAGRGRARGGARPTPAWLFQWGALDFAGGTVVHINAGIAGLVGALMLGKRVGYGREAMAPHSLTMTMIGASLLWVGWFGFNAGSNLEANGTAALAMINTFVATAAAALAWMLAEWIEQGQAVAARPRLGRGRRPRRRHAGLGLRRPDGLDRARPGRRRRSASSSAPAIKNALGYDDSLDVFGVHCIGGIIGAIGTGILVAPASAAPASVDYTAKPGEAVRRRLCDDRADHDAGRRPCCVDAALVGRRLGDPLQARRRDRRPAAAEEQEREGLDITEHGERAYNY